MDLAARACGEIPADNPCCAVINTADELIPDEKIAELWRARESVWVRWFFVARAMTVRKKRVVFSSPRISSRFPRRFPARETVVLRNDVVRVPRPKESDKEPFFARARSISLATTLERKPGNRFRFGEPPREFSSPRIALLGFPFSIHSSGELPPRRFSSPDKSRTFSRAVTYPSCSTLFRLKQILELLFRISPSPFS